MADRRLQIFHTVARAGNITRAAHILNMTQPAVSAQIQRFEQYYGLQLLHRHTDGVSLTEIGNEVYHYASSICVLQEAMDRRLKSYSHGEKSQVLRLAATPGTSDFLMRVLVKGFCAQYVDVDVEVNVEDSERVLYQLETKRLDLGLLEGQLSELTGYSVEQSWQDPLVAFVAKDHPLSESRSIAIEQLIHYSLICRDEGDYLYDQLLGGNHYHGFKPASLKIHSNFGSLDAVFDAVHLNLGIAVMPMTSVQRSPKESGCVRLTLKPCCSQTLSLVRHSSEPGHELIQNLVAFARAVDDRFRMKAVCEPL